MFILKNHVFLYMFPLTSVTIPKKQNLQTNYCQCLFHGYSAVKTTQLLRFKKPHLVHFEKSCLLYIFSLQPGTIPKNSFFQTNYGQCLFAGTLPQKLSNFYVSESHTMFILKNHIFLYIFPLTSGTILNFFLFQTNYGQCLFHGYSAAKTTQLLSFKKPHHVHFKKSCRAFSL